MLSRSSLPVRPNKNLTLNAISLKVIKKPAEPTKTFDAQVLRNFKLWLKMEKGRMALTANKRLYLCMVLEPDYKVPHLD